MHNLNILLIIYILYICTYHHSFSGYSKVYHTHSLDHGESKGVPEISFGFIDDTKAFYWVDHNKLQKTLKEVGIPDHLICLLRNQYVGQEAMVSTRHGTTDWLKIVQGVCQSYIVSLCLLNIYSEYITQNARLGESQAGIKTARRNINNLSYADDTTLMAESEEELKSLLVTMKEETEKTGLKFNIQKLKSWHTVLSL